MGIVVILAAAVFVGTVLVPFLQTRRLVKDLVLGRDYWAYSTHWTTAPLPPMVYPRGLPARPRTSEELRKEFLRPLWGEARALRRLRTYLRMPDWAAPNRPVALYLLGTCGPQAVPMLTEALADPDPDMRRVAAWQLGNIGADMAEAIPAIEKALKDEDEEVRYFAELALKKIRGGE